MPNHREYIEGAIAPINFPSKPSDPSSLKYAVTLLQSENVAELNKFYDHDHFITGV